MEKIVQGVCQVVQIQHKAKSSAVFDMRSHPEYHIFCTSQVNCALTDLLFCVVRIISYISKSLGCDAYKQIETIASDFLLPQEHNCKMEYINKLHNCKSMLHPTLKPYYTTIKA